MSKLIIEGQAKISGEITVKGAKNMALKIIPACILSDQSSKITNLPLIEDVDKAFNLISELGAEIKRSGSSAEIKIIDLKTSKLSSQIAKKFRASIMFTGPILARFKEVSFPHPGGCVIGAGGRPIDLFIEGFKALGAEVSEKNGYYHIKAQRLTGGKFFFPLVSVTATENLMMTAVLAEGKTILENCAMEPEIKALADHLNSQGAKISGAGTSTIKIEGVKKLNASSFEVIPDRIETGSFAILAAAAKTELTINKCEPEHIKILLKIFEKIGIPFSQGNDYITIKPAKTIQPYGIKTHEYPGFPTDLQSPYTLLMTQAKGSSLIHETIYDRRLFFVDMLSQMGADIIMCDPHRVVVNGPSKLFGRKLTSPDLRAGITILIAGLIAKGTTEIDNIYQIDRGYENIDDRLREIGAKIKRVGSLKF